MSREYAGNTPKRAIDQAWFRDAVLRWQDTVFRVAFNYLRCRADADDVCQEVFVSLYRSVQAKELFADDDGEHLKAWLIRATCNRCRSELRKPWRHLGELDDLSWIEAPPGTDPEQVALASQRSRDLLVALTRLPRRYRVALYLRYCEGYHAEEIAGLVGVRPATVRSWLLRGRKRLESLLEGDGGTHADPE